MSVTGDEGEGGCRAGDEERGRGVPGAGGRALHRLHHRLRRAILGRQEEEGRPQSGGFGITQPLA